MSTAQHTYQMHYTNPKTMRHNVHYITATSYAQAIIAARALVSIFDLTSYVLDEA